MAAAEVGDDVYGEDPTINALEERVAALMGHEAGLFVPSGTMGNQIGMRLLCQPGEEILCDADAHVVTYEMGAAAAVFGLSTRTVVSDGGRLSADRLIEQVRPRGCGCSRGSAGASAAGGRTSPATRPGSAPASGCPAARRRCAAARPTARRWPRSRSGRDGSPPRG